MLLGRYAAELLSILAYGLRLAGSIIITPLAIRHLSSDELGYWYLLVNIGGAVALLDFGLTPNVTRACATFAAGAEDLSRHGSPSSEGEISPNWPKIGGLVRQVKWLYLKIAFAAAVLMVFAFIGLRSTISYGTDGSSPAEIWWVFTASTVISAYTRSQPALLIGLGKVAECNHYTLIAAFTSISVVIGGLMLGYGLTIMVIGTAIQPAILGLLCSLKINLLLKSSDRTCATDTNLAALWPTTWRTGVVSVGAYMVNNASSIICAKYLGLSVLASFGLATQLFTAVQTIASVFLAVRVPAVVALMVRRRHTELLRIVARAHALGVACFIMGGVSICFAAPFALKLIGSKTALLPLPLLGVYAGVRFLEWNHSQFASLVMADNQVPFVVPSIASGFAIIAGSMLAIQYFGLWGVVLVTGGVQAACNNWLPVLLGLRVLNCGLRRFARAMISELSSALVR
ncbi:hypothetical protein [Opitutus sp. ER46]|uniref:hypothetical protein n=1 Tax=Opitutus sp. ER46 TaxID=2161864 RepID=UPI0011B1D8C9|nr:hypothetical protein [Opitutus sp. ER46]